MNVNYNIASPHNIACIVDLKIDMFREFGYDQYLARNAREFIAEDYARLYEQKSAIHFLAKVENRIVGMVGAFIKSDIPYRYFVKPQYGFIGDVYTMPTHRKFGISKKLNEDALKWLKDYGVNSVRLLASDAGRPIYEHLGFTNDVGMVLHFETHSLV